MHLHYNGLEVMDMQKSATINLRVDPDVKRSAESVLSQLGLSMSTAVDMFLRQVTLTGGIPFNVSLPQGPRSVDADVLSDRELREMLLTGLAEVDDGNGVPLAKAKTILTS